MTHVPYRGSATALQDLLGGSVDVAFDYPSSTSAVVKAGTLRALATLGTERVSSLPDVPTIAEAGVPGAVMGQTPAPTVDRLVSEIARVMEEPETRKKLVELGTTPMFVGGKDLQAMLDKETVKWRDVVVRARISAD